MKALDLFKLDGRVALITGGGGGLGLFMAKALSEAGASIAVTSRNLEKARECAEAISEATGKLTMALSVDVTKAEEVEIST